MNRDGNPPERRPLGLQSIYRLFGIVRHFRGEHAGLVFSYKIT